MKTDNFEFDLIKEYLASNFERMIKAPHGDFNYACFLPVATYSCQLWDWGCWTSNVAIRQIATDLGKVGEIEEAERGCVLNFLDFQREDGFIPIVISSDPERDLLRRFPNAKNAHKPCLCQHAHFISKYQGFEWLRPVVGKLRKFVDFYENHAKHESGLYFFFDDFALGVDNDPCTFYRPENSSASIFLNTLMYKELGSLAEIHKALGMAEKANVYFEKQKDLREAINKHCFDEKDGVYYSCDLNLRPIDPSDPLHKGSPRWYNTLIQRIGIWSIFMPLWAGIPDKEQAERTVRENLLDEKAFWARYGVRSLAKYEKMYRIVKSGNPSSWEGGIWGISNYMVFRGLLNYGYEKEAKELCDKTLELFSMDIRENGAFHEYYDPDTGKGVHNKDFLSWNMLIENMIAYEEGNTVITEA